MIASSVLACALVAVGQLAETRELYQDLRQQNAMASGFALTGPHISKYTVPEREGLRVTFPAKREKLGAVGLQNTFRVAGDFEITGSFEILSADKPIMNGGGVGANLYLQQHDDDKRFARLGRFNTTQGHVYTYQHTDRTKVPRTVIDHALATENVGQLRLVRKGRLLSYLVKDATTGGEFKEIYQTDFGTEDLAIVRFVVNTGDEFCAVDARLIDLRIRTLSVPGAAATEDAPAGRPRLWLVVLLVFVFLGGSLVVLWLRRAKHRDGNNARAPVTLLHKSLGAACGAAAGAGLLLALSHTAPAAPEASVDYDFRGRPLALGLAPFGPDAQSVIKMESEGLRMTLPKERIDMRQVGLNIPAAVSGSFEITTTFAILDAEAPTEGHGVGILLAINHNARVGWLLRAKGQQVCMWDRTTEGKDKRNLVGKAFPCEATAQRLRLKRTGSTLQYLWSPEDTGEKFQEIHRAEYGEEVTNVRLVAQTGQQPCRLDVRFRDLRVADLSKTAADGPGIGRLAIVATGAAVGGLAGWLLARGLRNSPAPATPEFDVVGEDPAVAANDTALVRCPSCHKRLKVTRAKVGKKVKCPGCAVAFVA